MICDQCETVVHCTKHGCIPKQPLQGKTVIELAREAGAVDIASHGWTSWVGTQSTEFLKRFEALVRADEREFRSLRWDEYIAKAIEAERDACAQVCGKIAEGDPSDPNNEVAEYTIYGIAMECANAIRVRGNK